MPLPDLLKKHGIQGEAPTTSAPAQKSSSSGLPDLISSKYKNFEPTVMENPKGSGYPLLNKDGTQVTPEAPTPVEKPSIIRTGAKKMADWFNQNQQAQDEANFKMRELMGQGSQGSVVKDPLTGKNKITTPNLDAYDKGTAEEKQKLVHDSNQSVPLVKFLNSDKGKEITGFIARNSSNLPLKAFASVRALGDTTYDEAYDAAKKWANDPTNPTWGKVLNGVQDSGVQSLVGVLIGLSVSAVTRGRVSPQVATTPYFAAISAEGQRQEHGEVNSIGNIAIDTIGDSVLSGFADKALKAFVKEGGEKTFKTILGNSAKGFGVEGGTEVSQSFLKYGNDYKNAQTEEAKKKVVADLAAYIKDGGMAEEFLVGGISGGLITGGASAIGQARGGTQVDPNFVAPPKETAIPGGAPQEEPPAEVAPVTPPLEETPVSETPPSEGLQPIFDKIASREESPFVTGETLTMTNSKGTTQEVEFIKSTPEGIIAREPISGLPMLYAHGKFGVSKQSSGQEIPASPEVSTKQPNLRIVPAEQVKEKHFSGQGNTNQTSAIINGEKVATPDQLVTKTKVRDMIKALGRDSVDFTVVEEGGNKYMTVNTGNGEMKIRPSALGLVETNIKVGDTININKDDLKKPGTAFRGVNKDGEVEASLATDLSGEGEFTPATSPNDLKHRIEQLNKFGQSYALLRRTGGLSSKYGGVFRHGGKTREKGQVHLQDSVVKSPKAYMSTLAHELGHALEYTLTGHTNIDTYRVFGKNLTIAQKAQLRQELKGITNNLVGEETAKKAASYYYKNTELLARFFEKMFVSPGNMNEIAPLAMELIEKSAVETPIVAEYLEAVYGQIDKGERKHIFLRDMRQTYTKLLGTRVGNIAWNNEVRYRSMKERAKILMEQMVKDKFKNVKDDPELLFDAAESIKVTKNGVPVFGTRDFQYAKNDREVDKLVEAGYEPVTTLDGKPIFEYIDGEPHARYAKERYSPEEGKHIYEQLSPEGKKLINDFTAAKEEAQDYFNREVIKDVNKIESNLEGWVHHYWDEKGPGTSGDKLKTKIAGARKHRKGAEGYVKDLQLAMTKALTEIETTKAYNKFIDDFFAQVTKPIAKGEKADEGWIEVVGDVRKGGVGTSREVRTTIIENGKTVPAGKVRYQMPAEVYERYQMISGVAIEAGKAMRVVNSLNRYWRVNILFHIGSATTNFLSGGIQYSTKVLTDFYTETLTGNLKYEKTRQDLYAMVSVLTPKGWQNAPDWVYGGDMSNFYGQFGQDRTPGVKALDRNVDAYADKALKLYGAIERYWKKVIATSESVNDLNSLNKVTKEGLRLPTEMENEILDMINEEADLYAYDYDNVPSWIENYQQHPLLQSVKPFMKYPYKYSKHVTEMIGSVFDQTLPWQERVAKLLALTTVMALYAYSRDKRKEDQETPEVPEGSPASVSTRGRLYLRTDENGNELFTRVSKYPFINLTEAGLQFTEGNMNQGFQVFQDMIGSVAPAGQIAAAFMGYKSEYQTYVPFPVIAGQSTASFVPGSRILKDIATFFDPYQRKPKTFLQGFTSFYPTTDPDLQKKLRGEIKTIQVPLEGNVQPGENEGIKRTTTDMFVKNYKEDILLQLLTGIYVNRIDPDVAEAFVIRKEENEEKKKAKAEGDNF